MKQFLVALVLWAGGSYGWTGAADLSLKPADRLPRAFREFLEDQNSIKLVREIGPSLADWDAEAERFGRTLPPEQRAEIAKSVEASSKNLAQNAEWFLNQGRRLGIFSANARWVFQSARCGSFQETMDPHVHRQGERMRSVHTIRLTFSRESNDEENAQRDGEYAIDLQYAMEFPSGWRVFNGFNWGSFPEGAASPELHSDLLLAARLPPYGGDLSMGDDPALKSLAERVTRFLQNKDTNYFATELLYSADTVVKIMQERSPERGIPKREEIEQAFASQRLEAVASAGSLLEQAERLEVSFADVEVREVIAKDVDAERPAGIPAAFRADEIAITLRIPESQNEAGSKALAGDYILASLSAQRISGRWYLHNVRWASLPKGALSNEEAEQIKFENYVAKHRELPPGMAAPDIEMFGLSDGPRVKLSDYRGKFVVLEWWATWCGPCQEPMAKLQKARAANPHWGEKVELVALSIDEDAATAREHLEQRGWTNTVNLWAGNGWHSRAAKAFRVSMIPSIYIINPEGRIENAGSVWSWEPELENLLEGSARKRVD